MTLFGRTAHRMEKIDHPVPRFNFNIVLKRDIFIGKRGNAMKKAIEKMIQTLLPDAIPEKDFSIEELGDGTAMLSGWNTVKLGPNPGLERLHDMYMQYVMRRKETVPTIDDSDPMPYLAEQRARRAREITDKKVEIIGNCAFRRIN